jgi:Zn-dependent protease with chaperone function
MSLLLHGQALERDDEVEAEEQRVYLSLEADVAGKTKLVLMSPVPLTSIADIRKFLGDRWSCTLQDQSGSDLTRRLIRLSPEQQAQIEAAQKEAATRNIVAECSGPLRKRGLSVAGKFDFQPLLDLLRQDRIQDLDVSVSLPDMKTRSIVAPSGSRIVTLPKGLYCSFSQSVAAQSNPISISFGYSRQDLIRLGVYTSLFVIIPFLIVLIMRTAALRRGTDDTAAAWFSFMQTTQVCVTGTLLLWSATPLNTRSQLSELLKFAGWSNGWQLVVGQLLIFMVPTWSVYLLCTALSYKVFVKIRNVSWTWTQFMARQLALLGRTLLPLSLYVAGIYTIIQDFRIAMALMGLAWLSTLVLGQFRQTLERKQPAAITSGPLRDRIFTMAQGLGVQLRHVLLIPAAETGVANAFATTKQTVVFTDYLIEKLNQREVDAVAAHELTHLRYNHAQKLSFMFLGAVILPGWILGYLGGLLQGFLLFIPVSARLRVATLSVFKSGWMEALVMVVLLWAYYLIRRKFEYTADAGAVAVTRDPDAMITALVKLSRLNLTPLQWSRRSEAMLTHPSTMRRLERIALSCGMPEPHLKNLITGSQQPSALKAEETYSVAGGTSGVVKTGSRAGSAQRRLLFLIAMHLIPPAAIVFVLQKFFPAAGATWWVPLAVALASVVFYHLGSSIMSRMSVLREAKTAIKTLVGKTGSLRVDQGIPVGFAPTPCPRYFVSGYNWDHGLLFLAPDKIVFVGSHCAFGLTREQVRTMLIGYGAPSWNNWKRVYCSWEDKGTGRSGTFNLLPLEIKNLFKVDTQKLYLRLRAWRNRQGDLGATVPSAEFGPPNFGAVSSMSAKDVTKAGRILSLTATMLALAVGISTVLKLDRAFYLSSIVLLIRLFESIPRWRYRERPVVYDAANAPTLARPPARAATAAPPPVPSATFGTPPPPPPPAPRTAVEPSKAICAEPVGATSRD